MNRYEKQLSVFKKWLLEIATKLDSTLSVKLWDGEIISLGKNAKDDIVFAINSQEAVTRLIYRPKLETVFQLYYEGFIEVEGGTPLEMLKRWDHIGVLSIVRSMSKFDLFKTFWPFVFNIKKEACDEHAYRKNVGESRDDKELVQFHYDISNAFYKLFLDENMIYSCSYFKTPDTSLDRSQVDKLDYICKKLRLKKGEKFLDIGCGWGALVCHAAQYYGVEAYGVTLSQAQYDYAQEKIKRLDLEDKVKVELSDYRNIEGRECFDKIAQIGMFEHIGFKNHDTYFELMNRLLKPRGLYLHHAITRRATWDIRKFKKPTAYQKVITKYIFPGAELDHIGQTVTNLERYGFEVHDVENLREHYQMTLEHWVDRLWKNKEKAVKEVGVSKMRLWLLYLSLFAISFDRGTNNLYQTLSSKRCVGPSGLPLTRKDLY